MSHPHGHAHDHGHSHDHAADSRAAHGPRPVEPGFSLFRLSAAARIGGALAAGLFVWLGVFWALD